MEADVSKEAFSFVVTILSLTIIPDIVNIWP